MRPAALTALLSTAAIFWFEPFGPWRLAPDPPAAATAPSWALVGSDTLRLRVAATRNLMPQAVSGVCAAPRARPVLLWVAVYIGGRPAVSPVPVDSVWFLHGSEVVLDRSPRWDDSQGRSVLLYGGLPDYAVGDPFSVLVSLRGLAGGQRYLVAREKVSAVF